MTYFDTEFKTTMAMTVVGIAMGYVSFLLNNSPLSFLLMIIIAAASITAMNMALKMKHGLRWWLGNGLAVYILMWLVVWTVFYNFGLR